MDARTAAAMVFAGALATVAAAWGFQLAGYAPCELCLMQRWAYYAGAPLAGVLCLPGVAATALRGGLLLLGLVFLASCAFGVYHAGVEWGFWQGPTACTGSFQPSGDILADLASTKVVRCDAVAIRIAGLSLAGWNAIVSLALAAVAFTGAMKKEAGRFAQLRR